MEQIGKRYLLDGEPVTFEELLIAAEKADADFGKDGFMFTGEAARILRRQGHTVEYNDEEPAR